MLVSGERIGRDRGKAKRRQDVCSQDFTLMMGFLDGTVAFDNLLVQFLAWINNAFVVVSCCASLITSNQVFSYIQGLHFLLSQ